MKKENLNISIIVAIGKDYSIGKNNDLLWRISEDLKRFKKYTTGNVVIMGRKTFESLPKGALPNRENIVITKDKDLKYDNCTMAYSIEEAIEKMNTEKENFIIGGATIYKTFLPYANKLYLTKVEASFPDADTYFPEIKTNDWEEIETEFVDAGERNEFAHTFVLLKRK